METGKRKPLRRIGSARDDLRAFPQEVRGVIGHALDIAQCGKKHPDAKPLMGFGGAGVLEVVDDFDGNAYRAVYTVKFRGIVYALHAFQKKSKRGIATPNHILASSNAGYETPRRTTLNGSHANGERRHQTDRE